jgi:maltose-binding protein MalE
MKKTIIFGFVMVLVLILSGCGKKNQTAPNPTNNNASSNQADNQKTGEGVEQSREDFVNWMGKTSGAECTITTDQNSIILKTKDGKTRVEETSKSDGGEGDITLNDGQFVYMWVGSEGIKYPTKIDNKTGDAWDWSDDQGVLLDEAEADENNYDCKDATLDDSIFAVPQDVQFTEENGNQSN